MAGKFLKVYYDMLPALENLNAAEAGRLLLSAIKYSRDGGEVFLPGKEAALWPMFMERIDRDNAKIKHISETNRNNVTKRYDRIRTNTTEYDRSNRKERSKEKNINNNTRFIPPTVDEVREYCIDRNNDIDPQHFIDYYASNGWRVGKNPMKDWKAAVRNWERNDSVKPKQNAAEPETNNPFLKLILEGKVTDD